VRKMIEQLLAWIGVIFALLEQGVDPGDLF